MFRRYPIGLSANIEKAFLQLGITPKNRDFLRFFYPDEGEEIVYGHCRVVFGVSLSPFLSAAVLAHLLENVPADDTQLGSKFKLSFYVDNCVTEVNDIEQQEKSILRSKEILSRGSFNLRNEWRHIPGKINPADLISRGCSPNHLVESHWWEGSLWLVESPDTWLITMLPDYDTSEISLDRKKLDCAI
ncbi:integrase catalytic domain-containing protein [Trichonephila clavipes]|uniref:Integrase catalytic domain-containing protein n=1 Tax=Trichonephila clavipes TaxID=2585209 RepID=A0A8X6V6Q7_TRICX|nr:integrase catalytic domain-containing protein [Trichonephila clavipes]